MSRLFIYDENMTDERAKITVAKMAAISDIVAPEKEYIQYSAQGAVTIMAGCVIAVGENAVFKTAETVLTKANLDQGSDFVHGSDYYIYICDPGTDAQDELYLISLNSSWPDGDAWDDTNTRKIGGFHYGRVRNTDDYGRAVNASGSVRGSGWESNTRVDILPNSVWTTKHRPKCDPSGMVYLGNALWGDIYLSSDDGANGLQSVYGGTPITGTEGLNWYIAGERARRVGKRLPDYMEFTVAADGSPQGLDASNANGHTATTNKARTAVGKIANAISALNICDLVGNVWKWLNELLHDQRRQVRHGMTFSVAVTARRICIQALACTPSLAAATGTTACVAAPGRWIATITRGTCTRTLACGACVTVCNPVGVGESPTPTTKRKRSNGRGKRTGTNRRLYGHYGIVPKNL